MPSHTKKVGPAGRFGARYGLRIRKKVTEIEAIQRQRHKCPACAKFALKRLAAGIWHCTACNGKWAGKAYEPGLESLAEQVQKLQSSTGRGELHSAQQSLVVEQG